MPNRKWNPFPTAFMVTGAILLIGGVSCIYRPAGMMLAGILLLGFGFLGRGSH